MMDQRRTVEYLFDRIKGCILGGAIGDALGYPVEFAPIALIQELYGQNGISSYHTNRFSKCAQISDDTQMTLFTAIGLMVWCASELFNETSAPVENYVYRAYIDWLNTQLECPERVYPKRISWIMDVPTIHERRAPGSACISSLKSGNMGSINCPINYNKGCGGIMRIAPVALYRGAYLSSEQVAVQAGNIAAITHGHPLGFMSAAFMGCLLHEAIFERKSKDADICLDIKYCKSIIAKIYGDNPYIGDLFGAVDKAIILSNNRESDAINIGWLGEGWVAEETLSIAIYCCLRHFNNFNDAICAAVNHGGDSDSTGAVTGNLMGAYLGYNSIEEKWLCNLEMSDLIHELAGDLCQCATLRMDSLLEDPLWYQRYFEFRNR